jgi:hypothetical protein
MLQLEQGSSFDGEDHDAVEAAEARAPCIFTS